MPTNGILNKPHNEILTFEEILRLVRVFASLGIKKVRLTGGEPLARKNIADLVNLLRGVKGLDDISITTNGALLSQHAAALKEAGLDRINISLDTLRTDRFNEITQKNCFYDVMKGLDAAKEAGFSPIKLNMVVMRGVNDDEVLDFVDFAVSKGLTLRFIEFMRVTPLWRNDFFLPIEEVKEACERTFGLERVGRLGPGPAIYHKMRNGRIIGFIKTEGSTCGACRRIRMTSTGELKICLYETTQGVQLKSLLRMGLCDEEIRDILKGRMGLKDRASHRDYEYKKVYMSSIGG